MYDRPAVAVISRVDTQNRCNEIVRRAAAIWKHEKLGFIFRLGHKTPQNSLQQRNIAIDGLFVVFGMLNGSVDSVFDLASVSHVQIVFAKDDIEPLSDAMTSCKPKSWIRNSTLEECSLSPPVKIQLGLIRVPPQNASL